MPSPTHWLFQTDSGLATRIAAGLFFFLLLALVDLHRRRQHATRWREYSFLFTTVAAALLYGVLNDQITSTLSWEYFYYGKNLDEILGPQRPPNPLHLHAQAALVGLKATWTAGLLLAVALLLANNPRKLRPNRPPRPQLPYSSLYRLLPPIFLLTALTSLLGGLLGYLAWPTSWSPDYFNLLQNDPTRFHLFACVYGIHLAAYLGAILATTRATLQILQRRRHPNPF